MKWIVILREPAARAYSEYQMNCERAVFKSRYGRHFTFEEALELETPKEQLDYLHHGEISDQYVQRGYYMDQLEEILASFNRSQLLVLISEEQRESRNYLPIYNFLGVSARYIR
jgi:hypothetical protein